MKRRVEYLENTEAQFDYEGDLGWVVVVDRKTGIAYSGFTAWMIPGLALWLREDVEEFILDEELAEHTERVRNEFQNLLYKKAKL